MTALASSFKQSSRFLRRSVLTYWLGSSLLIAAILTALDIVDHQQQIVHEGEEAAHVVTAALQTGMSSQDRQQLLEAYGQSSQLQRVERINVLLVVDRLGRIAYASSPAWRTLAISDPLLDRMAGEDPDFLDVINCFRQNASDCLEIRSNDLHMHLSSYTVIRPTSMPAQDLGLPRQPYLVMVNFDSGVLISDVLQDLPLLILLAFLIGAVLSGSLWIVLNSTLLPQVLEASQMDSLTQLMNRTSFMDLAMDLLAEAEERNADLVFAILDIDHFKRINDTYGHGCGDAALESVGSLLLTVTRPEDLVCRFGGEEFAMLIAAPREAGAKALERLRLQVEMNRLLYNGHRIPMTVSIGAACTSACGFNLDFLYNTADKALYAAKHGGRNRLEWNGGDIVSRLSSPATTQR